jgi:hypothetical protein
MKEKHRRIHVSPALVISCLALIFALAGSAVAAGVVGTNSVRSPQIVDGAVRSVDIHTGAVNQSKIGAGAVGAEQIADGSVASAEVAEGSLGAADLAEGSVGTTQVKDGALSKADIGANAVGADEVLEGAIGASELGPLLVEGVGKDIAANSSDLVEVQCPPGQIVISGGAQSSRSQEAISLLESAPSGNGWAVRARNNTNRPAGIAVLVTCLAAGLNK